MRLDGSQDLKGAQELRRQPQGDEGTPARERLPEFVCASKVRTFRPPPRGPANRNGLPGMLGRGQSREGGR